MKKLIILSIICGMFVACGDSSESTSTSSSSESASSMTVEDYDPSRGEGKFENVELGDIDEAMATRGEAVSEMKCFSCHKITDERLVGPGWAGVSERRTPEWLLNFITNPDPMIDKDPELQAQLEICMVRMPNQNISENEAFEILEFMRLNDAK